MKAAPIFLDFLNREASRAANSSRDEGVDVDIIRTVLLARPYGFSANISQITEYCDARRTLFGVLMKLISGGIIDATSQKASMGEFLETRRKRYAHAKERYPFYFSGRQELDDMKLGTRNAFDMTDVLGQSLLAYDANSLKFDLVRAHPNDIPDFEAGLSQLKKKVVMGGDMAITKDLLLSNVGNVEMPQRQVEASSRIISAMYMKIYAEKRQLTTCTGIPYFPYVEQIKGFPSLDYPVLRRALSILGGKDFINGLAFDEIIAGYATDHHHRFAFHLEAYLEALAYSFRKQVNQPDALTSFRALFDQFFAGESALSSSVKVDNLLDFFERGARTLLISGERMAKRSDVFEKKWRDYVSDSTSGLIILTTATDSEDKALFQVLRQHGFSRARIMSTGTGVGQEFVRSQTQRVIHFRTSAGSLGANSAGGGLSHAVKHLGASYVISLGICFGLRPADIGKGKQTLGDILYSSHIQDYETQRIGAEVIPRGDKPSAGARLLQAARIAKNEIDSGNYKVHEGVILSGQKLVDDSDFVDLLRSSFPEAIGGEMEGNAVSGACQHLGVEWIMIKGICDWGMGKEDGHQDIAAMRAAELAVFTALVLLEMV